MFSHRENSYKDRVPFRYRTSNFPLFSSPRSEDGSTGDISNREYLDSRSSMDRDKNGGTVVRASYSSKIPKPASREFTYNRHGQDYVDNMTELEERKMKKMMADVGRSHNSVNKYRGNIPALDMNRKTALAPLLHPNEHGGQLLPSKNSANKHRGNRPTRELKRQTALAPLLRPHEQGEQLVTSHKQDEKDVKKTKKPETKKWKNVPLTKPTIDKKRNGNDDKNVTQITKGCKKPKKRQQPYEAEPFKVLPPIPTKKDGKVKGQGQNDLGQRKAKSGFIPVKHTKMSAQRENMIKAKSDAAIEVALPRKTKTKESSVGVTENSATKKESFSSTASDWSTTCIASSTPHPNESTLSMLPMPKLTNTFFGLSKKTIPKEPVSTAISSADVKALSSDIPDANPVSVVQERSPSPKGSKSDRASPPIPLKLDTEKQKSVADTNIEPTTTRSSVSVGSTSTVSSNRTIRRSRDKVRGSRRSRDPSPCRSPTCKKAHRALSRKSTNDGSYRSKFCNSSADVSKKASAISQCKSITPDRSASPASVKPLPERSNRSAGRRPNDSARSGLSSKSSASLKRGEVSQCLPGSSKSGKVKRSDDLLSNKKAKEKLPKIRKASKVDAESRTVSVTTPNKIEDKQDEGKQRSLQDDSQAASLSPGAVRVVSKICRSKSSAPDSPSPERRYEESTGWKEQSKLPDNQDTGRSKSALPKKSPNLFKEANAMSAQSKERHAKDRSITCSRNGTRSRTGSTNRSSMKISTSSKEPNDALTNRLSSRSDGRGETPHSVSARSLATTKSAIPTRISSRLSPLSSPSVRSDVAATASIASRSASSAKSVASVGRISRQSGRSSMSARSDISAKSPSSPSASVLPEVATKPAVTPKCSAKPTKPPKPPSTHGSTSNRYEDSCKSITPVSTTSRSAARSNKSAPITPDTKPSRSEASAKSAVSRVKSAVSRGTTSRQSTRSVPSVKSLSSSGSSISVSARIDTPTKSARSDARSYVVSYSAGIPSCRSGRSSVKPERSSANSSIKKR